MEFWGIEVKPGESVVCDPGKETYLHLSQAALGETKKASENVYLYTKVNDQKLVLGTLSGEKFPQASFDLVFEKEFLLSHSSKSATVFVCGYKSAMADPESDGFSGTDSDSDSDSESESEPELEPIQVAPKSNGKIVEKEQAKAGKATAGKVSDKAEPSAKTKSKAEAKSEKPKPEDSDEDDSEDDDESDDDSDSEDEAMPDTGDDSDDAEDDDDSSDEDVTPKKEEVGKKRAGDSNKSSGPEKKAKLVTPATKKSDGEGKKGSHTATPYPKQVGKNASNNEKAKQQASKPSTPKSVGAVTCKSCSKTFNSENALQAHSKAKHEAK